MTTPPQTPERAESAQHTAPLPWARTLTLPRQQPPQPRAHPSAQLPSCPAAEDGPRPEDVGLPQEAAPAQTAPALAPPTWSGKKTAIAAALAIGFSTVGAIGAAAALPAGSSGVADGRGVPGGGQLQPGGQPRPGGQLQLGGQGGPGGQQHPGPPQLPGSQLPGGQQVDPAAGAATT